MVIINESNYSWFLIDLCGLEVLSLLTNMTFFIQENTSISMGFATQDLQLWLSKNKSKANQTRQLNKSGLLTFTLVIQPNNFEASSSLKIYRNLYKRWYTRKGLEVNMLELIYFK